MRVSLLAIGFVLAAVNLVPRPASADCIDYGDYLHWAGTVDANASSIAVSGSLAFVPFSAQSSTGLYLIDVDPSNAGSPEILSSVALGGSAYAMRVAASGGYAYVANSAYCEGGQLLVVDATDPSHPHVAGSLTTSGDISGVAASGTQVYLAEACVFSGLQVIDVSNPASPQVVGSVATPGDAEGVAVSGDYAYVTVDWPASLQVIDISDSYNPSIVGEVLLPGGGESVAVSGNHAYVGSLQVIDITDPQHPSLVGGIATSGGSKFISGTRLFIAGSGRLQVIDISDPLDPVPLGSADIPIAGGVAVVGPHAYVAGDDLHVFSLGNGRNPPVVGIADTPGQARDVAVAGDHAYVADHWSGLQVVDISDPASPQIVGSTATAGGAVCVRVLGTLAYAAMRNDGPYGSPGGLVVIDLADPQNPQITGEVDASHHSRAMAVAGPCAYIVGNTDTAGFLSIIDILDPGNPRIVGILDTSGFAYSLALSGAYAYVGVRTVNYPYVYSLRVVRITDPENLQIVASLDGVPVSAIAVSGNFAYFTGGSFKVVDITNPEDPRMLGSVNSPAWGGNFGGASVSGAFVYCVNDRSYDVVDVSDPERPRVIGAAPGGGGGVVISGDYLYSAGGGDGLVIRQAQCDPTSKIVEGAGASSELRLDAFPNPASRHVALRFSLASSGWTRASIHDVVGRLVRDLYGGSLRAGAQDLSWDGRDGWGQLVPAGMYWVRASQGDREAATRVMVLR